MKINNYGNNGINPYRQQQLNKINHTEQTNQNKTDKVEISTAAKDLQQLSSIESERKAKIDELKSKIDNGNYKIDSKRIAQNILKFYKR